MVVSKRALGSFAVLLAASGSLAAGCADGTMTGRRDVSTEGGIVDGGWPDVSRMDGAIDAPLEPAEVCEVCVVDAQCGRSARCLQLSDGSRACVALCNPDIPSCPRAFGCILDFSVPDETLCVPVGTTCCVDEDADGYGRGAGCMGTDCDDADGNRYPSAEELCDGEDNDCDGRIDEASSDCGGQICVANGMIYEQSPPSSCVDGECADVGTTSCGLYACSEGEDNGDFCATTCARSAGDDDTFCIGTAHCDLGACIPDVNNGEVCDEDTDCGSSHCDNGFCCNSGVCCGSATDCPGSGGVGAVCEDSVTCQGTRGELTCEMNTCSTRSGVPDDTACGPTIVADECGPYLPVSCTGAASQTFPRCPTSCAADSACDLDAHCDSVCTPDLPDGNSCDEDSDCTSDHCNNNICCSGGDCCRAPADCPGSYSTPATCDMPSACQGSRDAATCSSNRCGTLFDLQDDSGCSASTVASDCGLFTSRFCNGGVDQSAPMCVTACTLDTECDGPAHCDAVCVPDLTDGMACDEDSDCGGNHCQNGYCCATGDCCAEASDCPFGTYGEPSACGSAATCQGTRRDPVCNAVSQCNVGPVVGDDSGCAGLQSNDCALFPAVFCTAMVDQTAAQSTLCNTVCSTDAQCDFGAFCMGGTCMPRGMPGDACTATGQCGSGLNCVDGVCCTSTCGAGCMACNVPGSLGTCAPVPANTDPANECAGFSCSSYYAGWSGDSCRRRADASAAAVDCNGSGACETPAMVCPGQPTGTTSITCNALCQDPNLSTCMTTTAGTCTNVTPSPSTTTCGLGICQRTTNRCMSGTPLTCTPGTPGSESCNNLDDNCDGGVDNGLAGDPYEPNNTCNGTNIGTIQTNGSTVTRSNATLYSSGDVDVWQASYNENDGSCGCGGLFPTDEDYAITATLTVPAGAGSYRICANNGSCNLGATGNCVTVTAGNSGTVKSWDDGCCSPVGCNDSGTSWFVVSGVGSPGYECVPYNLVFGDGAWVSLSRLGRVQRIPFLRVVAVGLAITACDPAPGDDAGIDVRADTARADTPAPFLDASAAVGDWMEWDPASPGPFAVGYRSFDHTYTPVGQVEPRTIHVSVWYPTLLSEGPVARYSGTSVDRDAIADAPLAESIYDGGSYPVHVYSHGDRGWGGTSAFLMRRFASHGWVAVAPDHTGNTLTGNLDPRPPWLYYVRSTDLTAALDAVGELAASDPLSGRLALDEVIASGHSFGVHTMWASAGATFDVPSFEDDPCSTCTEDELAAFAAGVSDPRIVGIIPMAGAINRRFFGDTGHQSVTVPILSISGTADPVGADVQFTSTAPLPITWIDIEGACHQFFALGCDGDEPLDEDTIVGGFALAFARRHVLGDASVGATAILDGSRVLSDRVHFMAR